MFPCLRKLSVLIVVFIIGVISLLFLVSQKVLADEFLPTTVTIKLVCGDGFAEKMSGEVCDPGTLPDILADVGTTTCQDFNDIFGNVFASGDIGCLEDCSNFSTSSCYTCGNAHKEQTEQCDANDFGEYTCLSFGYGGGALLCTSQCYISTENCELRTGEGGAGGSGSSGGAAGGTTGFLPGSETEDETKVIVQGKSYPNADVHILVDGKVVGIVNTDNKANFYFETDEISAGVASFGFWSEDKDGLKSTLLTLTFRVISGAVTTISGVYISPTIEIENKSVKQGEDVRIYGQTIPETNVHIHIHSEEEIIEKTNSKGEGSWEIVFNTAPLEEDFHTAKALFQLDSGGNIINSGFSRTVSFYVGKIGGDAMCPEADLNQDGRVNLTDFSILLYHWGTDNPCADQNQNGVVDLIDFSIMMYYWTG